MTTANDIEGQPLTRSHRMTSLFSSVATVTLAIVGLSLAASGYCAQSDDVQASAYPSKPIRFLVGVAAGGGTDFVARLIAQNLTKKWGQPVVTDNRTGATGLIAMELTAKSAPDGYTAIVFNIGHLMSATMSSNATFDTAKDFAPVSLIATATQLLASHPSVPAANLAEFIAYAKSHPGKLNYSSGGNGSTQHLAMELLKRETGINLTHVPYKGSGPAALALVSGEVQALFANVISLYPQVKARKLRALAVGDPKRNPLVPDVPALAELGYPKAGVSLWQGIMLPAHTPPAIVAKLSRAIAEAIRTPDSVEKLASQGADPAGTTPREFAEFLQSERSRWQALAREAKLTFD
jgi:tripartite-type tricarboxylate transporter receptor subunit TctC